MPTPRRNCEQTKASMNKEHKKFEILCQLRKKLEPGEFGKEIWLTSLPNSSQN